MRSLSSRNYIIISHHTEASVHDTYSAPHLSENSAINPTPNNHLMTPSGRVEASSGSRAMKSLNKHRSPIRNVEETLNQLAAPFPRSSGGVHTSTKAMLALFLPFTALPAYCTQHI